MVPGGHADGRQLEPTPMSGDRPLPQRAAPVVLTPAAVGLPLLDRGYAESATMALVERSWPGIQTMIASGQYVAAIEDLVNLARGMRHAADTDPEQWRAALDQSRGLVYDAIVTVAEAEGVQDAAVTALDGCAVWDDTHRTGLAARRARLEGSSR